MDRVTSLPSKCPEYECRSLSDHSSWTSGLVLAPVLFYHPHGWTFRMKLYWNLNSSSHTAETAEHIHVFLLPRPHSALKNRAENVVRGEKNKSDEGRGRCPRHTGLFRATVVLCASPHNTEHNRSWTQRGTAPYLYVWESKWEEWRQEEESRCRVCGPPVEVAVLQIRITTGGV